MKKAFYNPASWLFTHFNEQGLTFLTILNKKLEFCLVCARLEKKIISMEAN